MYKTVKVRRRARQRAAEIAADRPVIEATATGSPMRIDDETRGIPLVSTATGAFAGELINPRGCYICKNDYTLVDAFYHWLCPDVRRPLATPSATSAPTSPGKRALLTGGRAKIGMYIALRLLRDGAHTTITTRFPQGRHAPLLRHGRTAPTGSTGSRSSASTCATRPRSWRWPTRWPPPARSTSSSTTPPRRCAAPPAPTASLVELESAPLPDGVALPEMVTFDRISEAHPAAIAGALSRHAVAHHDGESAEPPLAAHNAASMTALALKAGNASLEAHLAGTAVDAGGLLPDTPAQQLLDPEGRGGRPARAARGAAVQLDRPVHARLAAAPGDAGRRRLAGARRAYVVNVSAMEGQFSRRYKGPGHPHTNMAKAALNMLTRTSAGEMFETDQDPDDGRRHRLDHRRAAAPREAADRRRGLARAARPGRRRGPRLRPDRAAARPARTCTAASSRTTTPAPGSGGGRPPSRRRRTPRARPRCRTRGAPPAGPYRVRRSHPPARRRA